MEHLFPLMAEYFLLLGVALFWTIVYVLIIFKGFKDKACGMPFASICANITWEFTYTFIMPFNPLQQIVTLIWFLLDCIILFQFFSFAKKRSNKRMLYTAAGALMTIFFLLYYGAAVEFNDKMGLYSAFGINLLMSILFIQLLQRQGMQGQSLSIGFFKMIGTLCASIFSYYLHPQSILLTIMYIIILALDVVYMLLISKQEIKIVSQTSGAQKAA